MPAIYHEGSWLGNATDPEVLVKDTVGWTGKNFNKGDANHLFIKSTARTFNFSFGRDVEQGNQYTVSFDVSAISGYTGNTAIGVRFIGGSDSSDDWYVPTNASGRVSHTFTARTDSVVGGTDSYVYIYIPSSEANDATITLSNIMFVDARIVDPTYEPYHESVEVMYEEEIHGVNLLKNMGQSKTINGVTFTVNADGSVIANGTATTQCWFSVKDYLLNPLHLDAGSYLVNGCSGGSSSTHSIRVTNGASALVTSYNGETAFNLSSSSDSIGVYIVIGLNQTVSNLIFKPMIRKAEIEDSTYRPYNYQAIQNQLNAQGVLGAKNLLPNTATTTTTAGVTFTVNSDGSITANGTASGSGVTEIGRFLCKANTHYVLRGVDNHTSNISERKILLRVGKLSSATASGVGTYDVVASYDGILPTARIGDILYTTDQWISVGMEQTPNTIYDNFTIYPMIRLASDPDDTYQPYTMTNRELTEDRYYHAGDTVNVSLFNFSALCTNNSKDIRCTIPLSKDVSRVSNFTFKNTTSVAVRKPTGGYVIDALLNTYNVAKLNMKENFISFVITKTDDSAFDAPNNCCLDFAFTAGSNDSIITFS